MPEEIKSIENLTKLQIYELAEIFSILEKWQHDLELKQQKDNLHLDQHRNPIECHQRDSQRLS
jgi:hypothetical protein